ncbi:MAG: DUF2383 domain-containing protein [Shimia sp.]
MAQRLNNLNEIIATLRTGADYYRKAARQTDRHARETVFREHAQLREHHAKTLADIIEEVGGEVRDVHPMEKLWALTGRLFAWTGQTDRNLIMGLEEHEDRTQSVFRKVLQHPDNERDSEMLEAMAEDFRHAHDRMRELKDRFKSSGSSGDVQSGPVAATPDQPERLKADPPTPENPDKAKERRAAEKAEKRQAATAAAEGHDQVDPNAPQTAAKAASPNDKKADAVGGTKGASQAEAKPETEKSAA